jgi:hypothetical protein
VQIQVGATASLFLFGSLTQKVKDLVGIVDGRWKSGQRILSYQQNVERGYTREMERERRDPTREDRNTRE